jgi:DNA mismatch endonuclease, patch repair protein
MRRQRRADTKPERELRKALHGAGLRYRVGYKLPGTRRSVDVAFPRERVAVFVDGCFWHGCPQHATWPKANADWWRQKIDANRQRDRDTDRRLSAEGWCVVRVWEHEDAEQAAHRVAEAIHARRIKT